MSWIGAIGALAAATMAVAGGGQPHHTAHHRHHHHRHHMAAHASPAPMPTTTPQMGGGGRQMQQVEHLSAPLAPQPQGSVTLTVDPQTQHVDAQLNLTGLAPGTQHQVALYANGNPAQPAFTFPDVTVDGTGQLNQTVTSNETTAHGLPQIIDFRIFLQPTSAGPSQQIAEAHRVAVFGGQTSATLTFQSTVGRSGNARLTYDPATHQLTVSLFVSGLAAGSTHAAHIHTGSCQVQGGVAYMLPDLKADPAGVAFEKTTITVSSPPPATGWYVNVHDGDSNNILQNGQPTALFQPIACGNVQASS